MSVDEFQRLKLLDRQVLALEDFTEADQQTIRAAVGNRRLRPRNDWVSLVVSATVSGRGHPLFLICGKLSISVARRKA